MDILDKRLSKLSTESREVVDAYAEEYMSQLNRLAVEHMWREMLNESTDFISEAIEVEGYHDITNDYTQDVCYHFALCRLERDKRMNDEYKLELRLLDRGAA